MIKSILLRIGIVLLGIVVVLVGWGFFFYEGFYTLPPAEAPPGLAKGTPSYERVITPEAPSSNFTDAYETGKGIILIDLAHRNDFEKEELNVLILRLISRGLTVRFLTKEDDLEKELLGESEKEKNLKKGNLDKEKAPEEKPLAEKERPTAADAFIVVSPRSEFSNEEVKITDNFTSQGGKLLLITDPTRLNQINSLSLKFGLLFEPDYLYNIKENDLNYRNIFVTEFEENKITKSLKKIAFYTAGSISSANSSIAFVGEDTFSSVIETRKRLSPIALAQESKVLAISDLTFMTEPYNGILDNNQLISNVADWLIPPKNKKESK